MEKSILIISDLHAPYNHPDAIDFLRAIKKKYKPDRVISVGDEVDKHALSFHDSDPDLMSAGDELVAAREVLEPLYKLFPEMDLVDSNHGSMVYRKALASGIPQAYIKEYGDVLEAPYGWVWHHDLTIEMSDGEKAYICHGKTTNVLKLSQSMGMSAIQGHYHESFNIQYWGNPNGLYWGFQVGCLIDDHSLAFKYNKVNMKRPLIGCGIIINGHPKLLPLVKDRSGRWIGELV